MTDSFVTQCPHCQTSFKVGHAQLSVARGVVRCGACLQVFNAARQLLEQRQRERQAEAPDTDPQAPIVLPGQFQPAPPPEQVAPAALAKSAPILQPHPAAGKGAQDENPWLVSELDLDNLDLDEELARLEQRDNRPPHAFRPRTPPADTRLSARRDTEQSEHEQDDWIGSLRNDDVAHLPEVQAEVISTVDPVPDEPEPELEPQAQPESPLASRTEPSLSPDSLVVDDDPDEPETPALGVLKPPPERQERLSALAADDDEHDEHVDEPPYNPRARNEPAIREKALLELTDDPLQLDWQQPRPRRGGRLLWIILILLALLGLAAQYINYHFDHLARQDQYRPLFQQWCPQLGCKVPSKVDISQLKSSNLVVRSHPDFQGALVVDAIIYNRAAFSQPFPLLELRFADTGGQLIASRRFKPSEYLSGEMAGKEEMPPQTPIHIALDILDPGAKAVNYNLNFRSPE
ncbi:DUF3426 domain-containing protein [Pseudomonas ovata]|uniref:DUF3426 domain-containing protein n=1 Tax=Pseudomonas ovata TaxID=1839709 RepID=UPI000D699A9E|nr:DUF3426 domain-containing protein [Pseudomonas ovata]